MAGSKGGASLIERSQIHILSIPFVGDYVWIISAICNRYTPPLSSAKAEEDTVIAVKMLYEFLQLNELRNLIETEGIHRRLFTWTKLVASSLITEFPQLSEVEIRENTIGTYQMKMSRYSNCK